jgi:hypothetical protein
MVQRFFFHVHFQHAQFLFLSPSSKEPDPIASHLGGPDPPISTSCVCILDYPPFGSIPEKVRNHTEHSLSIS